MAPSTPGSVSARFSSNAMPEPDRLAIWHDLIGRMLLHIDIEPLPGVPLDIEAALNELPNLRLMACTSAGSRFERKLNTIADGNDDFGLIVNLGGTAVVSQRRQEVELQAGEAIPIASVDPGAFTHLQSRFISLTVPSGVLAPLLTNGEDSFMRRIPADNEVLRLLTDYLRVLSDCSEIASPQLAHMVAVHVHDLISLVIGAHSDAAVIARGRGLRAIRLCSIKMDIRRHLAQHGLTIGALAKRHNVTPRYIQVLFEEEGKTFSSFLLAERLKLAHRMLTESNFTGWKISTIAFECGFGDLSYFNRAFRRRYGAVPSDVRAVHCDRRQ